MIDDQWAANNSRAQGYQQVDADNVKVVVGSCLATT
jgi:hypothetical protein